MTVVFDGIASGFLLFLISVGLSVTLGLMNFVNLAHGAFSMLGGYVCVVLLNRLGVPFLAASGRAASCTRIQSSSPVRTSSNFSARSLSAINPDVRFSRNPSSGFR